VTHFLKEAGVRHAFQSLNFSETEKRAFLAALGRGALAAGKGLWGAGSKVLGGVSKAIAEPINAAGSAATNFVGKNLGASPQAISKFKGTIGKGIGSDMASYGLFSGGIGAATADPGERMRGFARGFGTGAVGGAVYGAAANATTAGLRKGLGAPGFQNMSHVSNQGIIGKRPDLAGTSIGNQATQRAKSLGAKALIGGVPMAVGTAASFAAPTFDKEPTDPNMMQQALPAYPAASQMYPQPF
jgi:hypothetical protein